jgi:II/X family phage/plasmid replication protein
MRVELVLKSNELREKSLHNASNWEQIDVNELFNNYLSRIQMSSQKTPDDMLLRIGKPELISTYSLWKEGHSLKAMLKKAKFYRHRRALLEFDIDIAVPKPTANETAKVIPLANVIQPKISQIPEWAIGTDLYFEPRKTIRA